jgi:hypothetical protein
MKKRRLFSIVDMIFLMLTNVQPVLAESNAELEKRIEALKKELKHWKKNRLQIPVF